MIPLSFFLPLIHSRFQTRMDITRQRTPSMFLSLFLSLFIFLSPPFFQMCLYSHILHPFVVQLISVEDPRVQQGSIKGLELGL